MSRSMKLSRYVAASDCLTAARSGFRGRLVFSTRSGNLMRLTEAAWQTLLADDIDAIGDEQRGVLAQAGILVDRSEDEFAAVVRENQAAVDANDVLYQVIQPSAWCELACGGCGQAHEKTLKSELMREDFLARVESRLASGRYRELRIGWFGAEPLTGIAVMRDMSPRLMTLAARHGCGYSARLVTSGLGLTPKVARELAQCHGVREVEIALNGDPKTHGRRRPGTNGKESFAAIFRNLCLIAAASNLGITLRCNVTRENATAVSGLIERIAEAGLAGRIRFYVSSVCASGAAAHDTALDPKTLADAEVEWLALQARLGYQPALLPQRRKIVCLSVQHDAEVVDAHGGNNCTETPCVPAHGQPDRHAVSFPVKVITQTQMQPAQRLKAFNAQLLNGEHRQCAACAMLPVCGGQCPKSWHEGMAPCPSTKHNIRHRLNLLFALDELAK
ncbi:uncharacterized protein SAMN06265795_101126 [Noviherbaspirillum humi]|uniref:Radical SAM core domain-containing protein n=1 Tax=Noviherbaspirillum humi TaxID=1688639 RepID=A0A239BW61_9BURK|nr:hypothetical protein [Noviherbaspirillum humi]SNS12247.1 uncharacterized protein SAMN06265795_101126 [Noviherbaspirillum humi]